MYLFEEYKDHFLYKENHLLIITRIEIFIFY